MSATFIAARFFFNLSKNCDYFKFQTLAGKAAMKDFLFFTKQTNKR